MEIFGVKGGYSDLWKAIIRPPKDEYTIDELGPKQLIVNGVKVKRTDLEIVNERGSKLQCSHWEHTDRPIEKLPCVIYLHGNSSSRCESSICLDVLIPQGITLFAFDFAGCGQSEGEFISLGWYEREDVKQIVEHIREKRNASTIALWGRSMGAVTSLMHADRDPTLAGLVLDSPFQSLRKVSEDLCSQHSSLPKFLFSGVLAMVRSSIQSRAKFDIDKLEPLENHVKQAYIPALFIAANGDNFIKPYHTKNLHEAYAGDKNLIMVDGDHNSTRPQFSLDSVGIFLRNVLQVSQLIPEDKMPVQDFSYKKNIKPKIQPYHQQKKEVVIDPKDPNEPQEPQIGNHKFGNNNQVQNAFDNLSLEDQEEIEMNKILELSLQEYKKEQDKSQPVEGNMQMQNKPKLSQNITQIQGDNQHDEELMDCFQRYEEEKSSNFVPPKKEQQVQKKQEVDTYNEQDLLDFEDDDKPDQKVSKNSENNPDLL